MEQASTDEEAQSPKRRRTSNDGMSSTTTQQQQRSQELLPLTCYQLDLITDAMYNAEESIMTGLGAIMQRGLQRCSSSPSCNNHGMTIGTFELELHRFNAEIQHELWQYYATHILTSDTEYYDRQDFENLSLPEDGYRYCWIGHNLAPFTTNHEKYRCDVCHRPQKQTGLPMLACRKCDFDVCQKCCQDRRDLLLADTAGSAHSFYELCKGEQNHHSFIPERQPRPKHEWDAILEELVKLKHSGKAIEVLQHRQWRGRTLLHWICRNQPPEVVVKAFLETCEHHPLGLYQDRDGNLPLHVACDSNTTNQDILLLLLNAGSAEVYPSTCSAPLEM